MEDTWVSIEDDDDVSSHYSCSDSDKIDSETEAELYSKIHYEEDLSVKNCQSSECITAQSSELFVCSPYTLNDVSCSTAERENLQTNSKKISNHISQNNINFSKEINSSDIKIVFEKSEQSFSPTNKRKSDYEEKTSSGVVWSNYIEDTNFNESSNQKLINTQNKKTRISSQNSNRKNNVYDSSDSDSDTIWMELDSAKKTDFKINLLNNTDIICISSSDSEPEILLPYSDRNSILKNLSMPNIKMGENSNKDIWHVNNDDLYRHRKFSRRYHEKIDVTCSNCSKKGHRYKDCPLPKDIKCFICGGRHVGYMCKNKICSNCYGYGHDRKRCLKRPNVSPCHLCNMKGHIQENCPDLWRRYHLTTNPVKITKSIHVEQDTELYCWNCGRSGHFGGVCPVARNYFSSVTTWPCVVSYDKPKRSTKPKERNGNFRRYKNIEQNQDFNGSVHLSEENTYVHLKPKTGLNTAKNFKKGKMNGDTSGQRSGMQFNKGLKTTQCDFPRTPNKKSPQKQVDEIPEYVELIMEKRRRNKIRSMRRKQSKRKRQRLQNTMM